MGAYVKDCAELTASREEEDGHTRLCGRKGSGDCRNHGLNRSRRCRAVAKSAITALEYIKRNIAKRHSNYFFQFYFLAEPQVKYLAQYCTSYFQKDKSQVEKIQRRVMVRNKTD